MSARVIIGGLVAAPGEQPIAYLTAFDAASGATAPGWTPREVPGGEDAQPTALASVPRSAVPTAVEPDVALGTLDGSTYLLSWGGDVLWDPPASPSANAGTFSYELSVDDSALLGTYVVRAGLAWTQGTLHQDVGLLDWFELVDPQGWSADDPYVITAYLTTWQGEWDT